MSPDFAQVPDAALIAAITDAYGEKAKIGNKVTYAGMAESVGYTQEELQSVPNHANLGAGCGSPVAAANLKQGEIVIDLGSGGGIDVFLAAAKVGPHGQVIGLDLSTEMISLARRNAKLQYLKPPRVAFVQASLADPLPIASNTVDCVISNCVITLLPPTGKANLLKEVYRILKPGGRVVFDDILAKQTLPDEIRNDLTSYINGISGSIQLEDYQVLFKNAGFAEARFIETKNDLEKPCGEGCTRSTGIKPNFDVNAIVASYQICAVKSDVPSQLGELPTTPLLRWWDAYPTVKSTPPLMSPEDLATHIRSGISSQSDIAVIDVRRDDHAGGHVRGSDNCHAQTFYDELPAFFEKYRNTSQVAFYCGSSSGRGPRCAGWYQDYLDEVGIKTSKAYVLQGGIKAWLAKYGDDERLVDKD